MPRLGFHAVAVLYTGGAIAQLAKLVIDFPWSDMPFVIDWLIVILGTFGAATLVRFSTRIDYRGKWEKPVHWLIVLHLTASVVLHVWTICVQNHEFYALFPRDYSYFAFGYFAFFAWRSWTVKVVGPKDEK